MMRRYRKGEMFRPPTAAESAANADALEGFRRRSPVSQDLAPAGQDIIVKTPEAGIDARDGTTISSAVCTRCIEVDGTSNTKTLVETDEELRIYNLYPSAVAGEVYVITSITLHGTRYIVPTMLVHQGKLTADLLYNDTTGVTVNIWTGTPLAVTSPLRTIDNVLPPLVLSSGQLDSGDAVTITWIDGRWYATNAPC